MPFLYKVAVFILTMMYASYALNTDIELFSCSSVSDCDSCNLVTGCHWCEDNQCHAFGSISGCTFGASCSADKDLCRSKLKCDQCVTESGCLWCDNTCLSQKDSSIITQCSNSTDNCPNSKEQCYNIESCEACNKVPGCHFCGDNKCHSLGSFYGCLIGIGCDNSSNTCNSYSESCDDCNAVGGCHWCEDGCHALGSVYGCLTGMSCRELKSCVRKNSEWRGYSNLFSTSSHQTLVIGVTCIVFMLLSCLCCSTILYIVFIDSASSSYQKICSDSVYIELMPLAVENDAFKTRTSSNRRPGNTDYLRVPIASRREQEDRNNPKIMKKSVICAKCICKATSFCLGAIIIILAIVFVTLTPDAPVISVCNQQPDYEQAISNLQNFKMSGDLQILLSIYNPSRFDVVLASSDIKFNLKHSQIGTLDIPDNITMKAGYIQDIVTTATIEPSLLDSWGLITGFASQNLVLDIIVSASVRVPLPWVNTPSLSFSTTQKVDMFEDTDRTMCKCREFLENSDHKALF